MSYFIRFICITALTQCLLACGDDSKTKDGKKDSSGADDVAAKVIYGEDNRLDLYQVQKREHLHAADGTVALISKSDLSSVGNVTRLRTRPYATAGYAPLCQDERFREQNIVAFCTGFLVAPKVVVTAGHCIRSASDCEDTRFVFGFSMQSSGENPSSVPSSEVYSCHSIIKSEEVSTGADYAVVELDRLVENHRPLNLRRRGQPRAGDSLYVVGYPSGLPTKVADGATVRRVTSTHLVASLDTFGGNSGSPVLNASTHEVEGILVRGEIDFVYKNGCLASKRCDQNACRGEDVTLITHTLPYIPEQLDEPTAPEEPSRVEFAVAVNLDIPDYSHRGVTSSVVINEAPNGRQVKVKVDIQHSWRGDLLVSLVSPDGQEVVLSNRQGWSADNLVGVFGEDLVAEELTLFSSVSQTGVWTLKVSDRAFFDRGTLNSWSLIFE